MQNAGMASPADPASTDRDAGLELEQLRHRRRRRGPYDPRIATDRCLLDPRGREAAQVKPGELGAGETGAFYKEFK